MRTEEQADLAAAVRSLLTRTTIELETGFDTALWSKLCNQIGVAGLEVADTAPVLEELGYSLAPTPLLTSLIASEALRGTDASDLTDRIEAGEVAAFVTDGPVLYGADATILLAVTEAGLVLLDSVESEPSKALDPTLRFATVSGTPTRVLDPDGAAALERARNALLVGVSALAVGCAQRALDMTVSYSKERIQFGRQIGSFQALKHRMADMLVLVEMARSAAWAAAAGELAPETAAEYSTNAAHQVAGEAIQLHGGIAITWEHDAHLVFKRAHALRQLTK